MKSLTKEQKTIMLTLLFVAMLPLLSFAITTPSSGSFAYDVYDIAVTKILKGPVGFVGGIFAMAYGAMLAMRAQVLPAIASILGGGILLGADGIVNSMGCMIM